MKDIQREHNQWKTRKRKSSENERLTKKNGSRYIFNKVKAK